MLTHEQLKKKMLEDSDVKRLYEQPDPDLLLLDEFLKARKKAKQPVLPRNTLRTRNGKKENT